MLAARRHGEHSWITSRFEVGEQRCAPGPARRRRRTSAGVCVGRLRSGLTLISPDRPFVRHKPIMSGENIGKCRRKFKNLSNQDGSALCNLEKWAALIPVCGFCRVDFSTLTLLHLTDTGGHPIEKKIVGVCEGGSLYGVPLTEKKHCILAQYSTNNANTTTTNSLVIIIIATISKINDNR